MYYIILYFIRNCYKNHQASIKNIQNTSKNTYTYTYMQHTIKYITELIQAERNRQQYKVIYICLNIKCPFFFYSYEVLFPKIILNIH